MTIPAKLAIAIFVASALASCDCEATPTGPSGQTSFLAGTWRGTIIIQVNPGDPNPPPPTSGEMTWPFQVMPQTNMQSLRATIRSTHPWLTMETAGSTALSPSNTPPTQISSHGEFNSSRLSWNVRERRSRGSNSNRSGLHRDQLSASDIQGPGFADERLVAPAGWRPFALSLYRASVTSRQNLGTVSCEEAPVSVAL